MQRYFMSISEAAQLILQAGAMGSGGEVYVLDMGNPVNIKDLAYELIRLSGLEPEKDISIEYIGSRPGEKLFEELQAIDENMLNTYHKKIYMMKNDTDNNWNQLTDRVKKITDSAKSYDINKIIDSLKIFIPEYMPDYKNDIDWVAKTAKKIINN